MALFRSTSSWSPLSMEMGETEAASRRPPSIVDDVLEFSSVLAWWWCRGREDGGEEDGLCPEPVSGRAGSMVTV